MDLIKPGNFIDIFLCQNMCNNKNKHSGGYHVVLATLLFFLPIEFSVTYFSATMKTGVNKFCLHFESGQVYCEKENQYTEIYFCLLFPVSFLSIFHSSLIHMEISVKDFSGTTMPRILKFDTNFGMTCSPKQIKAVDKEEI